jgi:multimeric flavodoxin WrbA
MEGADLIVLASPLHFLQVSGQLKVFIDRLTSTGGNPHAPKPETGGGPLRLAAIMSAGFPKPEAFRAVSLWMEDLASLLGRELFMEAYAGGARRLPRPEQTAQPAATEPAALAYLDALGEAGRLAAQGESLGAAVREGLKAGF